MKNFELEQMGVQEMDADEIKGTEGGLYDLLIYIFDNWDRAKEGFNRGFESFK